MTIIRKPNMLNKSIFFYLAISLLVACGGGGGGGGSTSSSTTTNSLTGVAAKGLLNDADVQAYEVTSTGLVAIGSAKKTAVDGSYSLADLPVTANPVIVKVTVNSSTTMLDEITGSKISAGPNLPVGFSMRSFVPDLTTSNEVHIQPFTELAISAAESSGLALSGETLSAGKDLVIQLLGVSPFAIKPRNPADLNTMSSDEKKMMLFLAGVAQDSKTASCTSTTGTSCALEKLKSEVKISYNPNTKTSTPDATKMASLQSKVKLQVTTAKTEIASKRPGAFANAMNNTTVTTALPTAVNVAEAQQRDGLENFIQTMRSGFNTAEKTINDRTSSAEARIKNVVTDTVKDSFDISNILKYNCTKISKTTTAAQFVCTNSVNATLPTTTFTKISDGKYSYEHYEQAIVAGAVLNTNNQVKYIGQISYELSNGANIIKMSASGTYKDKKYADFDIALKATDSLTEESLEFIKFDATRYDQAIGSSLAGTISLTGLKFSQDPRDPNKTISGNAPIKVTTSDGDGFSGSISEVKLLEKNNGAYLYQLKLSGAIFAKEGNLLNLDLFTKRSETYNELMPFSSTNFEDGYATFVFNLADNVRLGMEFDETSISESNVEVKITSNKNWIKLSAVRVKNLQNFSTTIKDNTIKVTSSGDYSATMVKSNGKYIGKLLKGTTEIGEITDGIIKTGGREISLN